MPVTPGKASPTRRASAGVPCTVVAFDTAPETKIARMRALGATVVKASFDACWEGFESRTFPGIDGTFVHPFDDDHFIAGNGTAGLEIVEDLPDVATVVTALGGGGLVTGVASAVRARKPNVRIFVAEPETAAPYARSMERGQGVGIRRVAAVVRRRRGRKERFPAHVGTDARPRRRIDRRDARRDAARDARSGRAFARDCRRRRRARGRRRAERQGGRRADRGGRLGRQHRSLNVLRRNRPLAVAPSPKSRGVGQMQRTVVTPRL